MYILSLIVSKVKHFYLVCTCYAVYKKRLNPVQNIFQTRIVIVTKMRVSNLKNIFKFTILKEVNVLFNDALNTFYLWLFGIRHMVKNH